MFHYVYQLTFVNGMKYIGMHSTTIDPYLDTRYLGSGRALPSIQEREKATKEILRIFSTRTEARNYEIQLIRQFDCINSTDYYNQVLKTHDKHGSSLSEEHKKQISIRHNGVYKPYLKKYSGTNRTPAQLAADERLRQTTKGILNPTKGHPDITNPAFTPWYYITPAGKYVEVLDKTKKSYATSFGVNATTFNMQFSPHKQHKVITKGKLKGYTFGNLPIL